MGKIRNEWGDVPVLEALEPRLLLDGTSYMVNSLADVVADDGVVTLREAIEAANTNTAVTPDVLPGSGTDVDIITFDQPALQAEAGAGNPLTITLNGTQLEITDNLDIQGLGAELLTVDADVRSRVFHISGERGERIEVELTGLTLTGGSTTEEGGGIYNNPGTLLTLTNSTVSGNSASAGGGICNYGALTLTNSTVSGNSALSELILDAYGGGIYNMSGMLTLTNSTVLGNSALIGGGIYNFSGALSLTNSTVSGNSADFYSGGIYNDLDGRLTLNNTIVALNDATVPADLAGSFTSRSSLVGVDPGFVRNPSAGADGVWGTPDDDYGDLRLTDTSLAINLGDDSLAVDGDELPLTTDLDGNPRVVHGRVDIGAYEYQGAASPLWESPSSVVTTLTDLVDTTDGKTSLREAVVYAGILEQDVTFAAGLSGGTITLGGRELRTYPSLTIDATSIGGLTIDAAGQSRVMSIAGSETEVSLTGLTLTGGSMTEKGGGIYNFGALTLTNSTVSGNSASGSGGGIYNVGTLTLTNSTVSDNSVGTYGGGISQHYGMLTLTNSTVSGNSAHLGGGIYESSGALSLTNSTVSGNSADFYSGGIYNARGTLTLNNTIVALNEAPTHADLYGSFASHSSLVGVDPGFVRDPSAGADGVWGTADDDYGDLRLLRTSPAVDSGDNALLPADEFDLDGDGDTAEELPIDLVGTHRTAYGIVDIGAYEGIFTPIVQEASIISYNPQQVVRAVFSEAMETGTFDPAEDVLSMVGSGAGHVLGYVWQDDRTLDLYCLLEAYGDYTLTLGPDIRSGDGEWMDADLDGIPGEPGEDNSILVVTVTLPQVTGDTVAGGVPVNSVTVTFDRPMRAGSFNAVEDIISFEGPAGPLSVSSWRWLNEWTLELDVDVSTAGDYTLVLGSDILDRSGSALDNDGDMIPGEAGDDDYSITFSIDSPMVTGFDAPTLPLVVGVTIYFSRDMDAASFSLVDDMLSFTNPAGDVVVTGAAWLDSRTLRLEIADAGTGIYSFQLGGAVQDTWGNALDGDGDGEAGEVEDGYTASFNTITHGTITEDATIGGPNAVIIIDGDIRVASGATLTVLAGTVLKFSVASAGITVSGGGKLVTSGTAQMPVTFTSYLDDSADGDTNGDIAVTTPSYSNWRGVRIESNGQAELTHTEVRYADKAIDANSQYATATLSAVTLRENNFGVYVQSPYAEITAENCLIADNNSTGVFVWADSRHTFKNSTIVGNGFGGSGLNGAGIHLGAAMLTLENCIVAFNSIGLHHSWDVLTPTAIVRNSIFYNSGQNIGWNGDPGMPDLSADGNMVADPIFVDRAGGNYELADASPAIDAGHAVQASATDILDRSRHDDAGIGNTGSGFPVYLDIGAFEKQTDTTSADLTVTTVNLPADRIASAGDMILLSWTTGNAGSDTAVGPWTDSVYLSQTPKFGPGAILLGTVEHTGELAPDESYVASLEVALPSVSGLYYVLVRTDSGAVLDEPSRTNNTAASAGVLAIELATLAIDATANFMASAGQWTYYRFTGEPGRTALLDLSGPAGVRAELYVRKNLPPTTQEFDAAGRVGGVADQQVRILSPESADYFVAIRLVSTVGGSESMVLTATLTGSAIREVTPNVIGNTGKATIEIIGDNFDPGAQTQLVGPDNSVIEAEEYWQDASTLFATFDLQAANATAGVYDLVIEQNASQTMATDVVTITEGGAGKLAVDLQLPANARPGRTVEITVTYGNTGQIDVSSPLLYLFAEDHRLLSWRLKGDDNWRETTSLDFLGLSSTGPVDVLRPSHQETVIFELMIPLTDENLPVRLTSFDTDSSTAYSTGPDWSSFAEAMLGQDNGPGTPAWQMLEDTLGQTWHTVLDALATKSGQYDLGQTEPRLYDWLFREVVSDAMQLANLSVEMPALAMIPQAASDGDNPTGITVVGPTSGNGGETVWEYLSEKTSYTPATDYGAEIDGDFISPSEGDLVKYDDETPPWVDVYLDGQFTINPSFGDMIRNTYGAIVCVADYPLEPVDTNGDGILDGTKDIDLEGVEVDYQLVLDWMNGQGWSIPYEDLDRIVLSTDNLDERAVSDALDSLSTSGRDQDDMAVFYFSGHGIWDKASKSGIVLNETTPGQQDADRIVNETELRNLLQASGIDGRVAIILDACHSGGMYDASVPSNIVYLTAVKQNEWSASSGDGSMFTTTLLDTFSKTGTAGVNPNGDRYVSVGEAWDTQAMRVQSGWVYDSSQQAPNDWPAGDVHPQMLGSQNDFAFISQGTPIYNWVTAVTKDSDEYPEKYVIGPDGTEITEGGPWFYDDSAIQSKIVNGTLTYDLDMTLAATANKTEYTFSTALVRWEGGRDVVVYDEYSFQWSVTFEESEAGQPPPPPEGRRGDRGIIRTFVPIDPEDLWGPAGYDVTGTPEGSEQRFVQAGVTMNYRIEQWNHEDAEVPPVDVVMENTLDPTIYDLSTFEFTRIGFLEWDLSLAGGQYFSTRVDCRPEMNIAVDIEATFDPDTGKIEWWLHAIDPETGDYPEDIMAGILPPYDPDTGTDIAWFEYRVATHSDLPTDTVVANRAYGEFDFMGDRYNNPAPKDGPWINTIDVDSPQSDLQTLPTTQYCDLFMVNWSGTDIGSGVAGYDIYARADDGPWTLWLDDTTETTGWYTGQAGHSYAFCSVATDNVGNVEQLPDGLYVETATAIAPDAHVELGQDLSVIEGAALDVVGVVENMLPGSTATADYGDGGGNEVVPLGADGSFALQHTFADDGQYVVTMSIRDPYGEIVVDSIQVTTLNADPTIDVLTGNAEMTPGHQASFTASASDPAGAADPLTYTWDFGDGSDPVSGVDLTDVDHTYTQINDYIVTLTVTDGDGGQDQATWDIQVNAIVLSRHVFYNNSKWDGNDLAAGSNDDAAIATDKVALLPGQTATFANYTSYSRGINGIMIDIAGAAGTPDVDDFVFMIGNDSTPGSWELAPAPTNDIAADVRLGAGVDGSDRVTLIWDNNAIEKQWLEVTVLATANTGLAEADVFYFGNAIGDTGDFPNNAWVGISDFAGVREHPRNFLDPAPIDDHYDINRDSFVGVADLAKVRENTTNFLTTLQLITAPLAAGGASSAAAAIALPAAVPNVPESPESFDADAGDGGSVAVSPAETPMAIDLLTVGTIPVADTSSRAPFAMAPTVAQSDAEQRYAVLGASDYPEPSYGEVGLEIDLLADLDPLVVSFA